MGAIAKHKTPVKKTGNWNGSKAITEAKSDAVVLQHMHAWVSEGADPVKKTSYKFAHHEPGTDTPAVIEAVNQALVRAWQENIPAMEKLIVEAHLRQHRIDAGLTGDMLESEIVEAVKYFKNTDDLKRAEADALLEAVKLQEKSNVAEWLESRLHLTLTQIADEMFGDGRVTRVERKVLSGAIGAALDSYHQFLQDNGPQLFARRPWEDAPEDDGEQDIAEGGRQKAEEAILLVEGAIALDEKAVRNDGTALLKIIEPGWGSSGYYPKEVLKRDGGKAFPKGSKGLWNHPTPAQEAERPEGDLNDLASELVTDARWMDDGPKGAGLYADAKVFEAYQPAVNDLAPHIGVSIHARGKGVYGQAEGRDGLIVQEILESPFNRVDYVTMPGAGGEIVTLFEAARAVRADKTKTGAVPAKGATNNVANMKYSVKEKTMELEQLQESVATLTESNKAFAAQNDRLGEALAMRDAKDMVKEALAALSLPDVTKKRLVESLAGNPPMKDGALDKEVLAERIKEAVKAEVKYLEQVGGIGNIRGLGESQSEENEDGEAIEESLEKSFTDLGLSETAAKSAARGRK